MLPKFKKLADLYDHRPYSFPATLVQRFGGFVLDIGLLIIILIAINAAYKIAFDIPFERPRYRPPSHDMEWGKVARSFIFITAVMALLAFFTSKFHQATPGMGAFFMKALRNNGQQLSFVRAFGWNFTTLAPLLLANYLVLVGVKLEYSLSHFGLLNMFSLMLVCQALMFIPILFGNKRSLYDLLWDVKVVYYDDRPDGLHPMRRLFLSPFLLIALFFLSLMLGWGLLNINDRPLNPQISDLAKYAPEESISLWSTWRNEAGFTISLELRDPRCASKFERFHGTLQCPPPQQIQQTIQNHKDLILEYKTDILTQSKETVKSKYLTRESIALTDLVMADLILKWEQNPSDELFENWLILANAWKRIFLEGGLLTEKNTVLIHYNHILNTLPLFLNKEPSFANTYAEQITPLIEHIDFNQDLVNQIMAYEYSAYDHILRRSKIDYLPFMQPNATRNYFVAALDVAKELFATEEFINNQLHKLQGLNPHYSWYQIQQFQTRRQFWGPLKSLANVNYLYNPLGLALRDLGLQNFRSSLYTISGFHQNNAAKAMLRIYVKAMQNNIKPDQMADFMKTLPQKEKIVFQTQEIRYDSENQLLYYHLPNLSGLRDAPIGFRKELQF